MLPRPLVQCCNVLSCNVASPSRAVLHRHLAVRFVSVYYSMLCILQHYSCVYSTLCILQHYSCLYMYSTVCFNAAVTRLYYLLLVYITIRYEILPVVLGSIIYPRSDTDVTFTFKQLHRAIVKLVVLLHRAMTVTFTAFGFNSFALRAFFLRSCEQSFAFAPRFEFLELGVMLCIELGAMRCPHRLVFKFLHRRTVRFLLEFELPLVLPSQLPPT